MSSIILDLETTWGWKKKYDKKKDKWIEVSDKGSPFREHNRVVCVGTYCPVINRYTLWDLDGTDSETVKQNLVSYLLNYKYIVGHNIKFDAHWLKNIGVNIDDYGLVDTLVNEYLLTRGQKMLGQLGLNKVAPLYGGTNKMDVIKSMWENGVNTDAIPKSLLHKYLREDVLNTYKVWEGQKTHPNRNSLHSIMSMNVMLNSVTVEMEQNGMCIDEKCGKEIKAKFEDYIKEGERKLWAIIEKAVSTTDGLDIKSPKQLAELLYSLRLKKEKKQVWKDFVNDFKPYRDGAKQDLQRKIDECFDKLEEGFHAPVHPRFISVTGPSSSKKTIEYMKKDKMLKGSALEFAEAYLMLNQYQTWLDLCYWGLFQELNNGKINANFNQVGTGTGRYSCNNPNLLNLPSPKKNGGANDIRRVVLSRYGKEGYICAPDFSQIELRILFELSKSKKGHFDYENGIDIHTDKAKWAVDYYFGDGTWDGGSDKDRKAWRDGQKAVNFGLVYGLSPTNDLEKAMFEAFHRDYPEVAVWNEEVKNKVVSLKYYKSPITGMEYGFDKATQQNFYGGYDSTGRGWKNKALNFPVQGDAARVTQTAMIGISEAIKNNKLKHVHMIGQVYDQVILDVHKDYLDIARAICLDNMNGVANLFEKIFGYKIKIPIVADWSYGHNWFEEIE